MIYRNDMDVATKTGVSLPLPPDPHSPLFKDF